MNGSHRQGYGRRSKKGARELSQATGRAYHDDGDQVVRVESLPDGFKVVQSEYGIDFCCVSCDVPGGALMMMSIMATGRRGMVSVPGYSSSLPATASINDTIWRCMA
jgi:hypothetical protein